jgi:hypothetical protein
MPDNHPTDKRAARWKLKQDGSLALDALVSFDTALINKEFCAIRFDLADAPAAPVQLGMTAETAYMLSEAMMRIALVAKSSLRKLPDLELDKNATPAPYPASRHCIYCGATRYSSVRERLGDEHIIPLALDGNLILPEASCAECEGEMNKFEQFCHKRTFGPLRYHLGLQTRHPKERPSVIPLTVKTIAGDMYTREVPVEAAPATLFMPIFDIPDICAEKAATIRNIYTTKFWHKEFTPTSSQWSFENDIESIRSLGVDLRGDRLAMLLARIGHAFWAAECPNDSRFPPLLPKLLKNRPGSLPISYLVGGERHLLRPTSDLHELQILRRKTRKRELIVVRIRLFARFGAPTYYVVSSACPAP